MRLGESDEVREMFDEMGIEIKVVTHQEILRLPRWRHRP